MSETKPEIPAAMLDAAAKAIEKLRSEASEFGVADCSHLARAALKAAGVAAIMGKDGNEDGSFVDRVCGLIERQRERIAELEAELENIVNAKLSNFESGDQFRDWAQSRAQWTLCENPNRIRLKSAESAKQE